MDASIVALDLFHFGIIPDGVQERIEKAYSQKQRNSTLHKCLLRTCTNDAFMRACDIITSVQGNPKMSALGKDMQRRLESGVCVCVCVCVGVGVGVGVGGCGCGWVWVWMCVWMCVCECICVCVAYFSSHSSEFVQL